jgi:sensor histidine kinase YesM
MVAALRIVAGVTAAWLLAAVAWAAQGSLGSTLSGGNAIPFAMAVRGTVVQAAAWIPVTLGVMLVATRFPFNRSTPVTSVLIHLCFAVVFAFAANVLVVLGFWTMSGRFQGADVLVREGARWATINFHYALLIYAAVMTATQGVLFYKATRARELQLARVEAQLARAQVQALNAQIRPHFLFNTLHTIGQLWRSGRSDDADAVLDGLGSLFHKVQRSTSETNIPLAEEIEMVREYLAIEEVRFRDRLHVTICCTPEALACIVPPLLLQPLVENAVRHGISTISTAGKLSVDARVSNEMLRVTVVDDGPGVSSATPHAGSGTGLRNTRERLAQLHGSRASLRVEAGATGGTIATIQMPAITASQRPS